MTPLSIPRHWSRTRTLWLILGAIFVLYVLFQARNFILGPRIAITSPAPGESLAGPVVTVSGTGRNIAFMTLNDRPVYLDEGGHFSVDLLPSPGLAILSLKARDRFGRESHIIESIVVAGPPSAATTTASSTSLL